MTTYYVEHKRVDCGEELEYVAPYSTAEERDEHARVLLEEDPEAREVRTYESTK